MAFHLMLCGSLDGRGVWGRMDTYLCMVESLHCSAETITTFSIGYQFSSVTKFSLVQSFSCVRLFAPHEPQYTRPPCPSQTGSLLKLMSVESVMPSNHLTLCCPLLFLPSIFPSVRVFSNELVVHIIWPKYWSFSLNVSPSNEYSGLISFRMDWLNLLAFQETLKSLLQHHSSKASVLWCSGFFTVQLSHPYMTTGQTIALTRWTFVGKGLCFLMSCQG